ncbi:TonB-linked SusC/RagA family outer membrane protein [Catalinimonas alkaloidigena]|uniref:SusC/RagA family TonB-linked outer membrane protein n=1 Tax=Catalinimonas alkaloidigena TaxID=1075417 RepID=UPI002404EB6C|nr:TonB-dependent receptor [Catalinimonas alkaloidigena]MDF9799392.1 TonB-linked SusC/RagA family outer membrane protein [Catalinimonas alkaloidigena]
MRKLKQSITLTVILCCWSIIPLAAQNFATSQQLTTFSSGEKNESSQGEEKIYIIQALDELSKTYQVFFTYNTALLKTYRVSTEYRQVKNVKASLETLLKQTHFSFKKRGRDNFVIVEKEKERIGNIAPDLISPKNSSNISVRQVRVVLANISGKVTAISDNSALPGVNVLVKGTNNGTVTDVEGNYTLNVPNQNDTLIFSSIGYVSEEIPVNGRTSINVAMAEDIQSLNEVVVVGYGTQKKSDLTGAIATVTAEDFAPGTNSDAVQLLNGSAPGVKVSQVSSAPGGGIKIQIRGAGSINSSNEVLFVVDGLPGVDPSSLSPQDIESIDVLKDASAAAIYGTRAANGVVLITTKKGKAGQTTFSYDAYYGTQSVSKQLDVLGGADYMQLINLRSTNPVYTDEEIASIGEGTNWQDEIFTRAPIQNHQLSMSGGNDNGNYYIGLNYFDQEGIVKTSSNKKYNARINAQTSPLENLLISANMNFTRENTQEILFSNAANDFAGPINTAIQFDPSLPPSLNDQGRYYLNPTIALDNPVALIEGIDEQNLSTRFYGSLSADYEVVNNLTATVRLGAEIRNARNDFYRSRVADLGRANGGIGNVGSTEFTHWVTDYLLKYENTFNGIHDFSILGGATFEEFITRGVSASSAGFLSDVTQTNLLQSGDGELRDNVSSSQFKNQLNGFLGRMTYGYEGKYLLTASFRVDGSSRFSEDNKYAFFPSASVGWRISEEAFMEGIQWVDNLKLRAGYGELGNQGINNFETIQTLVAGGNSVFGGAIYQGVVPARLPNPDLKWETTAEVNLGLDFAFVNGRISGSIDYFNRKTTDQLFVKPLPSVVGFSSVRTNLGEVKNSGVDFGLQTVNVTGKFSWNSSLNMSFLKNEVTKLPEFTQEIIGGQIGTFISNYTIVQEGAPLLSYYGYEINGIFQEGDDIESAPTPDVSGYAAGMPRFVDQNEDGVIDDDDRVILGDPFPDFSFGFNNRFRYQGISLDVYILGVQGIETLDANVTESLYPTNDARNSISRYYLNRWTPENPSNELPSGINPSLYGGARIVNTLTVADASFVRLKNITLGYDIPLETSGALSSLRVYLAAENLLTITDFEGYDPDASAAGENNVTKVNYNSYPLARTFRVGVNVQF